MAGVRQALSAPGAPPAVGPYSHGVIARDDAGGGLLFCSGQIPLDPETGQLVGGTAAAQARRCLENLQAVCRAASTTLERAVRVTVYMTDLAAFAERQRGLCVVLRRAAARARDDRGRAAADGRLRRDRRDGRAVGGRLVGLIAARCCAGRASAGRTGSCAHPHPGPSAARPRSRPGPAASPAGPCARRP